VTPEQVEIIAFLRDRYAENLTTAHAMANAFVAGLGSSHGLSSADSARQARRVVHAAEARIRFLDEAVIPYLDTAGPTGLIADQQLRLLADEHRWAADYDEGWRP